MRLALSAISLVLFLGGCFPAQLVERPAVIGRVLDNRARAVSDARIAVRTDWNQQIVDQATTDAAGRFSRPAAGKRWFVYFLPQDIPPPPKFDLEVSSAGLAPVVKQFEGGQIKVLGIGPGRVVNFGEIRLP